MFGMARHVYEQLHQDGLRMANVSPCSEMLQKHVNGHAVYISRYQDMLNVREAEDQRKAVISREFKHSFEEAGPEAMPRETACETKTLAPVKNVLLQ